MEKHLSMTMNIIPIGKDVRSNFRDSLFPSLTLSFQLIPPQPLQLTSVFPSILTLLDSSIFLYYEDYISKSGKFPILWQFVDNKLSSTNFPVVIPSLCFEGIFYDV